MARSKGMWTAWARCSPSQLKTQANLRIIQYRENRTSLADVFPLLPLEL